MHHPILFFKKTTTLYKLFLRQKFIKQVCAVFISVCCTMSKIQMHIFGTKAKITAFPETSQRYSKQSCKFSYLISSIHDMSTQYNRHKKQAISKINSLVFHTAAIRDVLASGWQHYLWSFDSSIPACRTAADTNLCTASTCDFEKLLSLRELSKLRLSEEAAQGNNTGSVQYGIAG